MRDFIRKITPGFLLSWYRNSKKNKRNKELTDRRDRGEVITESQLLNTFRSLGIKEGDTLLVHSSLSKIGFVENGPKTVVDALLNAVGTNGHLLMPTSPNASLQYDYIRELEVFDVANSPSRLGVITEYFRKLPEVKRSAHPTEPVACVGPEADYFTEGHFGELTPYTAKSPFYRVSERGGKILYMGVTLDNAGTNLHTLEDAVADFEYPVYHEDVFDVKVRFENGEEREMKTRVHNPVQSAKRKCDGLIPLFVEKGVMQQVKIGEADALLTDAKKMLDCMIEEYENHGVTMYTPLGTK